MTTSLVHSNWTESTLVHYAIQRAGTDAEPLDVLCMLGDMLANLEELAPGVPFADILKAWDPESAEAGRSAVAEGLVRRGVSPAEVAEIMGEEPSYYGSHPEFSAIIADYELGISQRVIAVRHGVSRMFVRRLLDSVNTPRESKLVEDDPEFDRVRLVVLANPTVKDPQTMHRRARAAGLEMGWRRVQKVMELVRS